MVTKEQIIEEIKKIIDPELGIDIWTLGLIYDIKVLSEKEAYVLMTFTSPMCPAGGLLISKVQEYVKDLGFEKVDVEVTFDPAWTPTKELREMLGV
jgi:metal-sulfur cluster biosynthetic enzyme